LDLFTPHVFPLKEYERAFEFAMSRKGIKAILKP
jgi:hypothetical protein